MRIEDHTSGCVAHMAVLNGNFVLESPIRAYPVPAGSLHPVSTSGGWRPSES